MDVLEAKERTEQNRMGERDLLKGLELDTNKRSGKAAFQKHLRNKTNKNWQLEFLI